MRKFIRYMTHPDKPGVVAPMRNTEAIERHIDGGWILIPMVEKKERVMAKRKEEYPQTVKEFKSALKKLNVKIPRNATKDILSKLYEDSRK